MKGFEIKMFLFLSSDMLLRKRKNLFKLGWKRVFTLEREKSLTVCQNNTESTKKIFIQTHALM